MIDMIYVLKITHALDFQSKTQETKKRFFKFSCDLSQSVRFLSAEGHEDGCSVSLSAALPLLRFCRIMLYLLPLWMNVLAYAFASDMCGVEYIPLPSSVLKGAGESI